VSDIFSAFGEVVEDVEIRRTRTSSGPRTETSRFLSELFSNGNLPEGKAFVLTKSLHSPTFGEEFANMDEDTFDTAAKSIGVAVRNQAHSAGFDPTVHVDPHNRRITIIRGTGSRLIRSEEDIWTDIPTAKADDKTDYVRVPYGTGDRTCYLTDGRLAEMTRQ
jgi:hypothetical protein